MDTTLQSPASSASLDLRRARVVPVRELGASERPLFLEHLLALPADDRYLRFGSPLTDAGIERYVVGIDFATDTLLAVFDDRLQIAAAGHFAAIPRSVDASGAAVGRSAEFGLSVAQHARGKGLATALFLRAASHARNLRISTLFMHCLSENRAMMRIARKAGMEIRRTHGEADAYLALKPGTVGTAIEEGVQRQIALFDFLLKRQLLLARRAFNPSAA